MKRFKAIQTLYRGILYRSRLEARWACFFYTAGIKFQYEAEGYELENGMHYLPDFYLPEQKCFVEVKGVKPTREEETVAYLLSEGTGKRVHIFSGQVPEPEIDLWSDSDFDVYTFSETLVPVQGHKYSNHVYAFNKCPVCGKVDFAVRADLSMLPCGCVDYSSTELSPVIRRAFKLARMARFE